MSKIELEHFNKTCRLCLKQENTLMNIFSSDAAAAISEVISIMPREGDNLPENVCTLCIGKLKEFSHFKKECHNNNKLLQSILILNESEPNETTTKNDSMPQVFSKKIEIKRKLEDLIPLELYYSNKVTPEKKLSEDVEVETNNDESNCDETKLEYSTTKCQFCCENIETEHFEKHLSEFHPADNSHYCFMCSKANSSIYHTPKQLQAHLKHHKRIPKFQCKECGKWFKYRQQKVIHMRIHTGERPAICQVCDKSFRDPQYLVTHLKSHTGEKPYKCLECQKSFTHKFTLKVHMKTHSSERQHMCNKCGKTFIYAHNLTIHERQHTGEKPYSCRLCFNSFISASILKAHMLTHSDEKRFQCKTCGKKFKRTGDLNVHNRSHTGEKPYACTVCGNKYKMASHLTEHMKVHTGEKNFICEECRKPFYNNKALQVHKKTHLGQKSYKCSQCEKSFVHHTSLYAHQRKHHK